LPEKDNAQQAAGEQKYKKNMTHTLTHNRFTALLDFVREYLGKPAPER